MTAFTPCYAASELERLFKLWVSGSLDGIASRNNVSLGVLDCDRASYGFRSQSLAERYTSKDLKVTIEQMAQESEPAPTYAVLLMLKYARDYALQDIARSFNFSDCSYAQSFLIEAQDEFMRRLLSLS